MVRGVVMEMKQMAELEERDIQGESNTRATPKTPWAPVTKNTSPTYSPEIHGWDFSWLGLLEWLEEGG